MIQPHTTPGCARPRKVPRFMTVIDDTTPRTEEVAALVQRWLAEDDVRL